MKVFVAIVLAIGSVSALGSGPYLPSGWRPEGPAFFLPSEVQKPVKVSVKEAVVEEAVASGSDTLQEYGPPKVVEVSQEISNQGLPDAVTEQTFLTIEAKFNQEEPTATVVEQIQETAVHTEQEVVEEAVTLGVISVEELTTSLPAAILEIITEEKSADVIEATTDATTDLIEEKTTETVAFDAEIAAVEIVEKVENNFQNVQEAVEVESTERTGVVNQEVIETAVLEQSVKAVEEVVQVEEKAVEESVKNIAEALVNLENEVKSEQVQTQIDVKTIQENSASLEQDGVGFLEYGPPGFREYGPPKDETLLRSSLFQESSDAESFENNETRKRRFSPKLRSTNKHGKQH